MCENDDKTMLYEQKRLKMLSQRTINMMVVVHETMMYEQKLATDQSIHNMP